MNQADYISLSETIAAGEAAQSAIVERLCAITDAADTYRESRIAEWQDAFAEWKNWRKGPDQSVFTMRGSYHAHTIGGDTIQLTYEKCYSGCDPSYYTCFIPLSLMWATDDELTTYLKSELEATINRELERTTKSRAAAEAQRRAQFEQLKAEFGEVKS